MKYISLFSGIEAASVAWEHLGWKPVAFSEIDDFPSAVLAQNFPGVPNIGDITKVDWSEYSGKIDVVVGGSPCQSFSVAGKREGLKGESGLMFEYIRAVREIMPRYFVWENVPGALTSEKGKAFGQLLREMDDLGYGLAWRILDAQFFGVPQRRRRIFLVGCLGNAERAAEILFEPESLCWDFAKSEDKRKDLARAAGRGVEVSGGECLTPWDVQSRRIYSGNTTWPALYAGDGGGRGYVACYSLQGNMIGRKDENGPQGGGINDNISFTLNTIDRHAVAYAIDNMCDCNLNCDAQETGDFKYVVRRLTPTECERLQGFPDGWTDVEFKNKPALDSRRYKALGNSMAVPVMRWIGERIDKVDK